MDSIDRERIPAERLHPKAAYSRCRPICAIRSPKLASAEQSLALVFRHQTQAKLVAVGGPPAKNTPKISAPTAAGRGQRVRRTGSARLALQKAELAGG